MVYAHCYSQSIDSADLYVTSGLSRYVLLGAWRLYLSLRLVSLLFERVAVDVERNVFDHLVSHYKHNNESVGRMCAYRKSQVRTGAVKEMVPVFYMPNLVHFRVCPSSSSSSQINYLGSMNPQKVSSMRLPFQSTNSLTSSPISRFAMRFRFLLSQVELRKCARLSAAWCSSQDQFSYGHSLWFQRQLMRLRTPAVPSLVLTEKLRPVSGKQLPCSSYLEMRCYRTGMSSLGSLRTLLISLRRMEAMVVYDIFCGIPIIRHSTILESEP